ncbi:endolytic transglycosylase MltG [Candidimonas sp. SYP-B2681]|uniref:endolytic transglycosylase MltG n=1 Tax=Candidimonas sp. SYP-B2681 TaxID=2497686 RepID=UPI000F86427D|nr:endolytic transglycosylase MltG [Candidimonas sp. SYP-B2681]RTZ47968.1 endolytic transglycosylase MltG [Candidimonas sp. SYP-B2681]
MTKLKLIFLYLLLLAAVIATGLSAVAWYWVEHPVAMDSERIDYIVEAGSRPRSIAQVMNKSGIHINETAFVALARLTGRDKLLKAGAYEAMRGDTPRVLLERMANGDMSQTQITLIEGWTYQRVRQALRENPRIRQTMTTLTDAELLSRLGSSASSPEGLFYPDTYVFNPGSSDFDILRRAYHAQEQLLESAWAQRDPDLPLKTPYEALVLASIIEKETGHSSDRDRVSGVFINRLRLNMPLQTDPTVIYGMGEAYQGRIRKKDLQTDTPWNTYTRGGLPPTPIANAGRAALTAALHPEKHKFLYFVSRGDGTSEFSQNLLDHNRAVSKYILGRGN